MLWKSNQFFYSETLFRQQSTNNWKGKSTHNTNSLPKQIKEDSKEVFGLTGILRLEHPTVETHL